MAPAPESTDCGSAAGAYVGPKDLKLWVTRIGTLTQDNPLRPLTKDRFVLLQLVVNGRIASAYGPDFDHLQRAGAPQDIDPPVPKTIAWDAAANALPRTIRVVGDDGTELLGPITFSTCGEPPKVAPPASAKGRRKPAAAKPRSGLQLPQGAIE